MSKVNKNYHWHDHQTISHPLAPILLWLVITWAKDLEQKMPKEYWSRWVNSAPVLLWPNMLDIILHIFSSAFQRKRSFSKILRYFFRKNVEKIHKIRYKVPSIGDFWTTCYFCGPYTLKIISHNIFTYSSFG